MRAVTGEYARNSDKLTLFIDECLERMPGILTRLSEIYRCYQLCCQDNGYYPENAQNFKGQLAGRNRVERQRPTTGGSVTTVLADYRVRERGLSNGA